MTLPPKRLALLRHAHQRPARNIRALAQALGRDYRRVHEDVEALEELGTAALAAHDGETRFRAMAGNADRQRALAVLDRLDREGARCGGAGEKRPRYSS